MARPREFNYHIRRAHDDEAKPDVLYNYRVFKQRSTEVEFNPDLALNEYHVWGESIDTLICDCPAAMYHQYKAGEKECKHLEWVREAIEAVEAAFDLDKGCFYSTTSLRLVLG
jgi:predicted nucleic acid-binding Zn finger protein